MNNIDKNSKIQPKSVPETGSHFPRSGIFLVLFISLIICAAVFLLIYKKPVMPEKSNTMQAISTLQKGKITLQILLVPDKNKTSSLWHTAEVTIDTHGTHAAGVQAEIAFDKNNVSSIGLQHGSFLTNPIELSKSINYIDGTLQYVVTIPTAQKGTQGKGTILNLIYQQKAAGSTGFRLQPSTIVITDENNGTSQNIISPNTNNNVVPAFTIAPSPR